MSDQDQGIRPQDPSLDDQAFGAAVLQASGTANAITDRRGTIVVSNTTWDDLFASSTACDLMEVGGSIVDGLSALTGGDRDLHLAVVDVMHGRRVRCTADVVLDDGSDRWISVRMQSAGTPEGHVVVAAFDVTALKATEAALAQREHDLRVMMESVGVGMARLDSELRVTSCNPGLTDLFGEHELVRVDLRDLVAVADVGRLVDAVRTVRTGEIDRLRIEVRGLRREHGPFWCAVTITACDDEVTVVIEDIDELRRTAEALRRSERVGAVARLTTGLAHELRSPLQFVGDNLRFMERSLRGEPDVTTSRHALADALTGVRRMSRLADALRWFGGDDEEVLVDVSDLMGHVLTVAHLRVRNIEITDRRSEVPLVTAVPSTLAQAALALIVDAASEASGDARRDGLRRGQVTVATRLTIGTVEIELRGERVSGSRAADRTDDGSIELARAAVEPAGGTVEVIDLPRGRSVVLGIPAGAPAPAVENTNSSGEDH